MAAAAEHAGFQELSHLFFNIKLVNVIDYVPPPPLPPPPPSVYADALRSLPPVDYFASPGKKILEHLDESDKKFLLADFKKDDKILEKLDVHLDKDDPDFIHKKKDDNIGFFMEDFIVKNGTCPICNTPNLRKHIIHNMPAVDLLCINKDHPINRSRLFQVKTSIGNSYFTREIIPVGSRYFGQFVHSLTPTNHHKNITLNYICIDLVRTGEFRYEITENSYILLPQLDSIIDEPFYAYRDPAHITFNLSNVSMINCSSLFQSSIVNRTLFSYEILNNPFHDSLGKGALKLKFNGGFYYKLNKYIHKLNIIKN
jgi:hypothetical protein